MADRIELNNKLKAIDDNNSQLVLSLTELITEMTNAFNRFLAKLAQQNDYAEEITKLDSINQKVYDANVAVQSAIAQAKVEGI